MGTNLTYLEKATTSSQLQTEAGFLSPAQADKFIEQMFDATVLLQEVRRVVMRAPQQEINKLFVGSRITRAVDSTNENEDMSQFSKNPTFSKILLAVNKYSLSYEISNDALEDNIEKGQLEMTLARHFSTQFGIDMEDLAINGDNVTPSPSTTLTAAMTSSDTTATVASTSGFPDTSEAGYLKITTASVFELIGYGAKTATTFTGLIRGDGPPGETTIAAAHSIGDPVDWSPHPLIGRDDGILKIIKTSTDGVIVDGSAISSGDLTKTHFFEAFRQLPNQYKRGAAKGSLRWVMSYHQYINWQEYLANQTANRGYDVLSGTEFFPLGIPVIAANHMPDSKILLTFPLNLIFGVYREMKIRKASEDKESIMRDMQFFNALMRADVQVERRDACVLVEGLTGDVA